MTLFPEDPKSYVKSEYEARHARNPAYSWRSFARDLSLSPSMLSEFLKGRYGFSRAKALHVADTLQLDEAHTEHFIDLLESDFHRTADHRRLAKLRVHDRLKDPLTNIGGETLAHILDWTYFALLEVVGLDKGRIETASWTKPFRGYAAKLDSSLRTLLDLKLVRYEDDQLKAAHEVTVLSDQLPPREIEKLHAQVLELGLKALEDLTPERREAVSVFASIRTGDLPELKKELNDMFLQILNKYSSRSSRDAVFCFALQAFPLYERNECEQATQVP